MTERLPCSHREQLMGVGGRRWFPPIPFPLKDEDKVTFEKRIMPGKIGPSQKLETTVTRYDENGYSTDEFDVSFERHPFSTTLFGKERMFPSSICTLKADVFNQGKIPETGAGYIGTEAESLLGGTAGIDAIAQFLREKKYQPKIVDALCGINTPEYGAEWRDGRNNICVPIDPKYGYLIPPYMREALRFSSSQVPVLYEKDFLSKGYAGYVEHSEKGVRLIIVNANTGEFNILAETRHGIALLKGGVSDEGVDLEHMKVQMLNIKPEERVFERRNTQLYSLAIDNSGRSAVRKSEAVCTFDRRNGNLVGAYSDPKKQYRPLKDDEPDNFKVSGVLFEFGILNAMNEKPVSRICVKPGLHEDESEKDEKPEIFVAKSYIPRSMMEAMRIYITTAATGKKTQKAVVFAALNAVREDTQIMINPPLRKKKKVGEEKVEVAKVPLRTMLEQKHLEMKLSSIIMSDKQAIEKVVRRINDPTYDSNGLTGPAALACRTGEVILYDGDLLYKAMPELKLPEEEWNMTGEETQNEEAEGNLQDEPILLEDNTDEQDPTLPQWRSAVLKFTYKAPEGYEIIGVQYSDEHGEPGRIEPAEDYFTLKPTEQWESTNGNLTLILLPSGNEDDTTGADSLL